MYKYGREDVARMQQPGYVLTETEARNQAESYLIDVRNSDSWATREWVAAKLAEYILELESGRKAVLASMISEESSKQRQVVNISARRAFTVFDCPDCNMKCTIMMAAAINDDGKPMCEDCFRKYTNGG